MLLAIGAGELVTMGMMLGLRIIPFEPQYVIPISGMIIGNSMVASSLTLNRIKAEIESRREEILVLLGLGATARQASGSSLQAALKSAMIPTIDLEDRDGPTAGDDDRLLSEVAARWWRYTGSSDVYDNIRSILNLHDGRLLRLPQVLYRTTSVGDLGMS